MAKTKISLEKLMEVGAHFGHQSKRWNPRMEKYMFEMRDGVYLFDLVKTKELLEEALDILKKAAKANKTILFVGTKRQAAEKIKEVALATGNPYVDVRWLGGTFTNFDQVRSSVKKLQDIKEKIEKGEYKTYTKKEKLMIERKIEKMNTSYGGILEMNKLPDMLVVFDIHKEHVAVAEANHAGIPVLGVVDSNSDPGLVKWAVPMNDDATLAADYVLDLFKDALNGK